MKYKLKTFFTCAMVLLFLTTFIRSIHAQVIDQQSASQEKRYEGIVTDITKNKGNQ